MYHSYGNLEELYRSFGYRKEDSIIHIEDDKQYGYIVGHDKELDMWEISRFYFEKIGETFNKPVYKFYRKNEDVSTFCGSKEKCISYFTEMVMSGYEG